MFSKKKMGFLWALAVAVLVSWTSYSYPPYGDYSLDPGYGATLAPGKGFWSGAIMRREIFNLLSTMKMGMRLTQ